MSSGVFYVATGEKYGKYARAAIDVLRRVENCPVTVFCDLDAKIHVENISGIAIRLIDNPLGNWNDKIFGFLNAPYEKSVYIDCDTIVVRPFLEELSEALENRIVMARSAGIAFNYDWETEQYPVAIPQCNTGVIAFRRDDLMPTIRRWAEICEMRPGVPDQPTFRAALIETGVAASELPAEYNFLPTGVLVNPVRIYHLIAKKNVLLSQRQTEAAIKFALSIKPPAVYMLYTLVFSNMDRLHIRNLAKLSFVEMWRRFRRFRKWVKYDILGFRRRKDARL